MATRAPQLYDKDFYAWTRAQAAALRRLADQRWNGPLDLPHLADEIEDLGSEQQWAVERQLERIIEHLLELEYSPSPDPRRQWMISVIDARGEIERRMSATIQRGPARTPGPLSARAAQSRTGTARPWRRCGRPRPAPRLPVRSY
jgi:hypothetical protein